MNDDELLAELNDVTQGEVMPQVDMATAMKRFDQCRTCDYNVRLTCGQTGDRWVHCMVMVKGDGYTCPVGRW